MKVFTSLLILGFVVVPAWGAPCSTSGGGTVLGNAANGLSAGQWCEIDMGATAGTLSNCPGYSYLEYQGNGYWDPVHRIAGFIGASHNSANTNPCSNMAHVYWQDATNTWTEIVPTTPEGVTSFPKHGWDKTVSDPSTGDVYFVDSRNRRLYKATWGGSSYSWENTGYGYPTACQSGDLETVAAGWDNTPGHTGIVTFTDEPDGVSCFWDKNSRGWTVDGTGLGNYEAIGGHSQCVVCSDPADACWLVPYGTRKHSKNSGGTVTPLAAAPESIGCAGGASGGVIAVDPISGKFISSQPGTGYSVWREFDITTDTWSRITYSMPPLDSNGGGSETNTSISIGTYNAILYIDYNDGTPRTYLYKHADGGGGTGENKPPAPSGSPVID